MKQKIIVFIEQWAISFALITFFSRRKSGCQGISGWILSLLFDTIGKKRQSTSKDMVIK